MDRNPDASPKGRARRAQVLAIARELLAARGLDGFVLREVATRAGMTLGNLQYYFRSRDDLLAAVVGDELDRYVASIRARADDLDALTDELLAQCAGEGGSAFVALAQLARREGPGGRWATLHQEVYRRFATELAAVLRRHDAGAGDDELVVRARVVTAMLDGLTLQRVGADPADRPPLDDAVGVAVRRLVAEVAAGRTAATGVRGGRAG